MMKYRIRDVIISIFLISTISLSVILVSCSEDGRFNAVVTNNGGYGNPPYGQGFTTAAMSQFFKAVGEGAEGALGFSINGWILSAMGLAGSSPDYEAQIKLIENDLDSIIVLLNDIGNELAEINQTLLILNCSEQQSSLQTEIGRIEDLLDQYNGMLATANSNDTIPRSLMQDWSDQVLARNAYSGQQSVGQLLSTIETNVSAQTGALYSCIVAMPVPAATGTTAYGVDSNYYNNVEALTNYYYYYQAIALSLLSEAYHYEAWAAAGYPNSDTLSSDSIQAVCSANGTSATYCNDVRVKTNELYNSLLAQFSYGGASYTNEHTILQNIQNNPIVWVRSLEDFTSQAGYNCPNPLKNELMTGTIPQPCGPTIGCGGYSTLSDTVYRGTSGFSFANADELSYLVDPQSSSSYNSNGAYLEASGFRNMSDKTFVSGTPGSPIVLNGSNQTFNTVPFFFTDQKAFSTGGELISVYKSSNALNSIFPSSVYATGTCTPSGTHYQNENHTLLYSSLQSNAEPFDIAFVAGIGNTTLCLSDGDWVVTTPMEWKYPDSACLPPPCPPPGFLVQNSSECTVKKDYRFLMPKVYALDVHCKPGRIPVNISNVPTMCGEDFNIYLNVNVPRPPTCSNTSINPLCTTLN